ncbi:MAG: Lrp/AsnC ligand binding domain-containing protein [Candidatus Hermodarchaeota archaeon]
MAIAYVLINAKVGQEYNIRAELEIVEGVEDVTLVYGVYDVIARIQKPNLEEIKSLILSKIRKSPYVTSTITLVAIEELE